MSSSHDPPLEIEDLAAPEAPEQRHTEEIAGAALLVAAVVAIVWASVSPEGYASVWHHPVDVDIGSLDLHLTLQHWINSGLMTVFFFMVGLEIKRELVTGDLRDPKVAALPSIAALGGMLLPAAIYLAFNAGTENAGGWGIPMATDIAFAMALIAVLGARVSPNLRLFLLALAVVDDIGAIIVIAVVYSSDVSGWWLAGAALTVVLMLGMRRLGVWHPIAYVAPALLLWLCLQQGGVEAAIAGVVLGLLTPAGPNRGHEVHAHLEHLVAPVSGFVIAPLFALANAGVALGAGALRDALTSRVTLGVLLGLVVGKTVGVALFTEIGLRLRVGRLAGDIDRAQVLGAAAVAGIGFTVALFISELSFGGSATITDAKIGVVVASALAGVLGAALLGMHHRRHSA